ncbi:hypothetical protein KAZ66_03190 [Candidatus Woesebacteria bacterium]|nr:hypothetical protein [Candidatus Woesebacteria bacterium]
MKKEITKRGYEIDLNTRQPFVTMQIDETEAVYNQFELSPQTEDILEWMSTYFPDEAEKTQNALQLLNTSHGVLLAKRNFDGIRWASVELEKSQDKGWGVAEDGHWRELQLVNDDRLLEIWIAYETWHNIVAEYERVHKALPAEPARQYIPFPKPLEQKEVQEKPYLIVDVLQQLNNELQLSENSEGLIHKSDQDLHLTYFFTKTVQSQLSGFVKMIGQLSAPVVPEEFEKERQNVLDAINRFLFIIYDPTDPANQYNLKLHMDEAKALLAKIPAEITVSQEDKSTSTTYRILFNVPS